MLKKCTECTDENSSVDHTRRISPAKRQDATVVSKNRARRGVFSTAHPVLFLLAIRFFFFFVAVFLQPLWDQLFFFFENLKLHISREQINKGPYLHFWDPPVQ